MELVREADAAPLLAHVEDGAAPLLLDHAHGVVELVAAVAALGGEDVAREALGVDAHERRRLAGEVALDEREVFEAVRHAAVHAEAEVAVVRRQIDLLHARDELLGAAAVGNQIGDRHELEPVPPRERRDVGEARHAPVVLHDLAAEAHLLEPREAAEVDHGLRVAGALQHAARTRLEREHVPRTAEVLRTRPLPHARARRHRPLFGGDARRRLHAVDGDGEGGLVVVRILLHHLRQVEPFAPGARHRHADEAPRVGRHEVDVLGRRELGGADAVALVLTVLVVRDHDDLATPQRGEAFFDGIKWHLCFPFSGASSAAREAPSRP